MQDREEENRARHGIEGIDLDPIARGSPEIGTRRRIGVQWCREVRRDNGCLSEHGARLYVPSHAVPDIPCVRIGRVARARTAERSRPA